ncbi:chorismate mutase [Streptomyces lycii]|uniref:Chorismate mutase n=1 Tax=Streptomyces lycii TaxID=2654337 RepID=A0ABQ7FQA2_9ACTN|nr:chorismate mutase [Streptomyces lycii]KAF4409926.1 chorismate mutase [Streptomyces lycii]
MSSTAAPHGTAAPAAPTAPATAPPAPAKPAPGGARPASAPGTATTAVAPAAAPAVRNADGAASTGASTDEAAALIAGARQRIDDLDGRIIGLVQERIAVSAAVQEARVRSGGRRVSLSREMEILAHYRTQLGKPGTALAMTLLELCRGRV